MRLMGRRVLSSLWLSFKRGCGLCACLAPAFAVAALLGASSAMAQPPDQFYKAPGHRDLDRDFSSKNRSPRTEPPMLAGPPFVTYVDGDSPASGDGTQNSPFNTLAEVVLVANQNPSVAGIVYWRGTFREPTPFFVGLKRWTFENWPGDPPSVRAIIRGDTPIPPGAWTNNGDGTFWAPAADLVRGVVWNWDTNLTLPLQSHQVRRHFGHLEAAADLTGAQTTPGSWWYDDVSQRVYVNPPPGALNPDAGDVYAVCRDGRAIVFDKCSNSVFSDFESILWVTFLPGNGYGFRGTACVNCVAENFVLWDTGFHAAGFVGRGCDRCILRDGVSYGQAGSPTIEQDIFVFASVGGVSSAGMRGERLTVHAYNLLRWDRTPVASGWTGVNACLSHGSGSLNQISDIEWSSVTFIADYEQQIVTALVSSKDHPAPTDPTDPDTYSVRVIAPTVIAPVCHVGANISVQRGLIDVRSGTALTNPAQFMTKVLSNQCYRANVILTDYDASTNSLLFSLNFSASLSLLNNSIMLTGPGIPSNTQLFRLLDTTSSVTLRQNDFATTTPVQRFASTRELGAAVISTGGNLYDPQFTASSSFYAGGVYDTLSLWLINVDPGGAVQEQGHLAEPDNLEGAAGSFLRTIVNPLPGVSFIGFNGRQYSGNYGAYQYGGAPLCASDFNGDGDVNVFDLASLLTNWGERSARHDLMQDGVIDVVDLAILLSSWGACGP